VARDRRATYRDHKLTKHFLLTGGFDEVSTTGDFSKYNPINEVDDEETHIKD
jgi:hypothetical protein